MNASQSTAEAALQAFARRDLCDWRGLAPETSLADVAALFKVDEETRGRSQLGSERREAIWMSAMVEGYESGMRVWLDADDVLMLDAQYPQLVTDAPTLLHSVGEPEAKLDAYLGTFLLPGSEWVYPARGLTLYVNPENLVLLRLVVYVATTLDNYRQRLRLDLQMRRLPRRDQGNMEFDL
jgi:hypothetical protein